MPVGNRLERFLARYTIMVALCIVAGYLLVILKIYEVISIVVVFFIMFVILRLPKSYRKQGFREVRSLLELWMYDFLDGITHPVLFLKKNVKPGFELLKNDLKKLFLIPNLIQAVVFLIILLFSAYLRFYDPLTHAAPGLSDASTTLAWMKYIDSRLLFQGGIYPRGFHIYLSILHKFAACDALYILKYTGPFNGVLTTIGIYFFVAKITGRRLAGFASAFVYGILGGALPIGWERQSSTNSQEFAMVFLFPAWTFAVSFLQTHKKIYLWTAGAAFAVIGFVHSIILAFLWLGIGCLIVTYLFVDFKRILRPIGQLILVGVGTGIIAALPLPLGILMGYKIHESSLEYLESTLVVEIPKLTMLDTVALFGFGAFLLITLLLIIFKRRSKSHLAEGLFMFFLGISGFLIYRYVGAITANAVLGGRLGVLWALLAGVGVGVGWGAILDLIPKKLNKIIIPFISLVFLALMLFAVQYYKPSPPQPYKMLYDAEVNQYMRIINQCSPCTYSIVSNSEGYALTLGRGWHIQLKDFHAWFDPYRSVLTKKNEDGTLADPDENDYFIFIQKKLFIVDMDIMKIELENRAVWYTELEEWVKEYQKSHNNISVFYEDDDIVVYQIKQPKKTTEFEKIWGPNSMKE